MVNDIGLASPSIGLGVYLFDTNLDSLLYCMDSACACIHCRDSSLFDPVKRSGGVAISQHDWSRRQYLGQSDRSTGHSVEVLLGLYRYLVLFACRHLFLFPRNKRVSSLLMFVHHPRPHRVTHCASTANHKNAHKTVLTYPRLTLEEINIRFEGASDSTGSTELGDDPESKGEIAHIDHPTK